MQFANGYLFGEVLLVLSYLTSSDYAEFKSGNSTVIRLSNYALVTKCLSSAGVSYDSRLIPLIMTEARGASADLLLRIKSHWESRDMPAPVPKVLSTHSVRARTFVRPPHTDWGQDDFYERTMAVIGTQDYNMLDDAIHLKRFHDRQREMEKDVVVREETTASDKAGATKQRIASQIQRARDRARFMEEWIKEGEKSWKINDDVRRERETQRLRFELSRVAIRDRILENETVKHDEEFKNGANDFERIMKRLGVGGDDGGDDGGDGKAKINNESGLNYLSRIEGKVSEYDLSPSKNFEMMEVLKRKEKANARARKERETRRRKLLVDQRAATSDLEAAAYADGLLAGIVSESRMNREQAAADWELRKRAERREADTEEGLRARAAAREDDDAEMLRKSFAESRKRAQLDDAREKVAATWAAVDDIRATRAARKSREAGAVAEAAVAKLLDLVDVLCGERERRVAEVGVVGVEPAFLREAKLRFVGPKGFYKEPEVKVPDVWTVEEVAFGFAEGNDWLNGTGAWASSALSSVASFSSSSAPAPPAFAAANSAFGEVQTSPAFAPVVESSSADDDALPAEASEASAVATEPSSSSTSVLPSSSSNTQQQQQQQPSSSSNKNSSSKMKPTRERIYDSPDYRAAVGSAMSKLCKDYVATKEYAAWTLYEYASFLRRDEDRVSAISFKYQKRLLAMPTKDNTDFNHIEAVIDLFEGELGDICEERSDASRDVSDGSGGRGRQWIEGICAERAAAFGNLCGVVADNASYRIASLGKCLEVEAIEAVGIAAAAAAAKVAAEDAKRLMLEEEAAEKARKQAEEEAALAELAKKGKKPPKKVEEEVPVVDAAAEEAKLLAVEEAERALLAAEEEARLVLEAKRTRLQEFGLERLAATKTAFFTATASLIEDKWFLDSVTKAAEALDECEAFINEKLRMGGQQEVVYDTACIAVEMLELVIRVHPRFVEFQTQAMTVAEYLIQQLDSMCSARAKVESTAVVNLCKSIGAAAVTDWSASAMFNISFSTIGGLVTAIDAPFPGTVFDSRGNSVSPSFLRAMAKRLREASKGGSTVSIDNFAAVVARVVEKDCAYDDDLGALEGVPGRGGTLAWGTGRRCWAWRGSWTRARRTASRGRSCCTASSAATCRSSATPTSSGP